MFLCPQVTLETEVCWARYFAQAWLIILKILAIRADQGKIAEITLNLTIHLFSKIITWHWIYYKGNIMDKHCNMFVKVTVPSKYLTCEVAFRSRPLVSQMDEHINHYSGIMYVYSMMYFNIICFKKIPETHFQKSCKVFHS